MSITNSNIVDLTEKYFTLFRSTDKTESQMEAVVDNEDGERAGGL